MRNKQLRYLLGVASLSLVCMYGVYYVADVSAAKNEQGSEVKIETTKRVEEKIENVKRAEVKETKEQVEPLESIDDDKIYDEFGNEIITTGDEYDYPMKKEANTDTVVLSQDLLNDLLSFENYKPYNVKVREDSIEDYDVQISIDMTDKIVGKKADELLERYNRHVKARYLIDTETGWENVLIPFKLAYKNPLDDSDAKIEPRLRVYEACNYELVYKDLDYIPSVTTLYIMKSREERMGYIVTKLPILKVSNCTLEVQDLNISNMKGIEISFSDTKQN